MDQNDIAEIGNLPVEELKERLPALSLEHLEALQKYEKAGTKRAEAVKAIGIELGAKKAAAKAAAGGDGALAPAAAPAKSGPVRPAWQEPDYTGPLDIAQMEWRRHNIKPATQVRTK